MVDHDEDLMHRQRQEMNYWEQINSGELPPPDLKLLDHDLSADEPE
jgi:hypothetical protein